ncbi:hypothetical protein OS493_012811 [Desmophyllum pertusum]|uniref:Uncharacterized protein n=1 Tax=Desmophyllum pertusum TaxID=174260 RepID=A0A9W9Z4L4_9CNID|nr:hypothetical protein OS493_012811 [Desmophyllum pertusum]
MALNGPHSALTTNTGTKLRLSFNKLQGLSSRSGSSIRQQVMCELKHKFKTVSEAEDALGITVESYMEESPGRPAGLSDDSQQLSVSPALLGKMKSLAASQISDLEGLAASLAQGKRRFLCNCGY